MPSSKNFDKRKTAFFANNILAFLPKTEFSAYKSF